MKSHIAENGDVYSWGLNANGECGIGSYTNRVNADKLVSDLKNKGYNAFIDIYKK